jgi:hypothetical protein
MPVFGQDHALLEQRSCCCSKIRELTMGDGLARADKFGGGGAARVVCFTLAALAVGVTLAGGAHAENTSNPGDPAAPGAAPAQLAAPQPSGTLPAPPPLAATAPIAPAQPQAVNRPGFLHQLRVWWDDSLALFDAKNDSKSKDASATAGEANQKPDDGGAGAAEAAKSAAQSATMATQDAMKSAVEATKGAASTATDAMKGAVEATKNAATVIVRLPNTRVVELHETCARAPNGGADCAAAAANGCRAKGFAGGTPLDTRTAAKCDSKPPDTKELQAGQTPAVHCAAEAVVTRAVCQ